MNERLKSVLGAVVVMLLVGVVGFLRVQAYYDQRLNDWQSHTYPACLQDVEALHNLGYYQTNDPDLPIGMTVQKADNDCWSN